MNIRRNVAIGLASFCIAVPALAGSHSWRYSELFSNASGTVQFIEFTCPISGENFVNGLQVIIVVGGNTVNTFTFPNPSLPGSTANKKLLLATNGFAALPGAPARDYAIPANFFPPGGNFTIRYNPPGNYDTNIVAAGAIPTNGISSLQYTTFLGGNGVDSFTTGTNNPANYVGGSGSVNAACIDNDGDGFGNPGDANCANGPQTDCDDNNPNVRPNALEQESANNCGDGADNDCDTLVDCAESACANAVPACVPTVSEWGVLVMALLTMSAGSIMLRQRT